MSNLPPNKDVRDQVWAALNSLECVKNDEDRGEIFGLLETLGLIPIESIVKQCPKKWLKNERA